MAKFKAEEVEKEAVLMVAKMMASSARTAPKGRGVDTIETMIVEGDDLKNLASAMERNAAEQLPHLSPLFIRDAGSVRKSGCVLLIGVTGTPKKIEVAPDCGACGYKNCQQLLKARIKQGREYNGPNCVFQALDLGIALASAAKVASELNVDNRMMHTVGVVAKQLNLLDSDVIIGIPLSVTGKNPYFDRG